MYENGSEERRPRLTPAIADVRRAVREALETRGPEFVLVALSGGADSLALAAATAFEAHRAGIRAGAVIVDHGLQEGSAEVAARAADQAGTLGLDPVIVKLVTVAGSGGPEAAARAARYAALDEARHESGADAVLLAHTLDDQAETVLLGLARGSGAGSLQGMAAATDDGRYLRPLLGVRRASTRAFCVDSGLEPWDDPQNTDPSYSRVRVRQRVLPVLETELGPGIAEALARTADQLREDNEAFDEMIVETIEDICEHSEAGISVSVAALEANPTALRHRIIRYVVHSEFGVSLERAHVLAVGRLIDDWHGQGPLDLPGIRVARRGGAISFQAQNAPEAEHSS